MLPDNHSVHNILMIPTIIIIIIIINCLSWYASHDI